MSRRLWSFIVALLLLPTGVSIAQDFTITSIESFGDEVIINYSLTDSVSNRAYTINIYSSTDDYINPLQEVSGDIGLEVRTGGRKSITWNAKKELGEAFDGYVSLEIRGNLFIPFIRLDRFDDYKKFKLKKKYTITWTGGRGDQLLNFNLYKGENNIKTFPNIANVGEYELRFEGVRPGKGYHFIIEDSRNKDDVIITSDFTIKRKVPFILQVLPFLGAGYFGYILITKDPEDNFIVDPINPGGP